MKRPKDMLALNQAHSIRPQSSLKKLSILSIILIISSLATSGAVHQADAGQAKNNSAPPSTKQLTNRVDPPHDQPSPIDLLNHIDQIKSNKQVPDLDQSSSSARAHLLEAPSTSTPSITSVHQVWTSASSGRLDELSPEIISKLRSDVPFLAAYALRPRLVGGSHRSEPVHQDPSSARLQSMDSQRFVVPLATTAQQLETGASSPQAATVESLVPRLGDFSEFRVETSSTSKSEHHHKRKTSLKRRRDDDHGDDNDGQLRMKKRVLAEASQLVRKQQRRRNNNNNNNSSKLANKNKRTKIKSARSKSAQPKIKNKRGSSGANKAAGSGRLRRKGALLRSQARAGRLRAKMNRRNLQHHMDIIRHGRYQQQEPPQTDQSSSGSDGSTKGGDSSGVKGGGGGSRATGKKPFYSKGIPAGKNKPGEDDDDDDDEGESSDDNGDKGNRDGPPDDDTREETTPAPTSRTAGSSTDRTINEVDDDVELDNLPEPKRVGDPDVDEKEGDTVTVMPKFDGVDDDPEIPDDYEDTTNTTERDQDKPGQGPADDSVGQDQGQDQPEGPNDVPDQPRTRRVNRERQNEPREREPTSGDDGVSGGTSNVSGGGIGATVGNGSGQGAQSGKGSEDNDDDDGDSVTPAAGKGGERKVESGVEFANEDENASSAKDDGGNRKGTSSGSASGGSKGQGIDDVDDGEDDLPLKMDASKGGQPTDSRDFESMKEEKTSGGRRVTTGSDENGSERDDTSTTSRPTMPERDLDLDYRDDNEESEDRKLEGSKKSSSSSHAKGEASSNDEDKTTKNGHKSSRADCDDGSYNHDHDHHHDHHSHHDSIKWLQDAIPGEPNLDYPILSRANVTNFDCSEQKYPGYYADVEARCQVFHICQADGRQDSFLCPNGTIFSQKHYVCVWWNSFNCEDAPKYYDLNALLYKKSSSNSNKNYPGTSDLRPIDGGSSARRGDGATMMEGGADDEEPSSIDSLIRDMRRDRARGSGSRHPINEAEGGIGTHYEGPRRRTMDGSSVNSVAEDEATIQRKSTNIDDGDDESASAGPMANSARSSLRANNAEPRRKRRASVRQAPAKLNSRRVSRNSRRRRIRHGIKPKRRA